jgi:hypothetical protein
MEGSGPDGVSPRGFFIGSDGERRETIKYSRALKKPKAAPFEVLPRALPAAFPAAQAIEKFAFPPNCWYWIFTFSLKQAWHSPTTLRLFLHLAAEPPW